MEWCISIIKVFGKMDDFGVELEIKMIDVIELCLINC